jgi:hypothetical protein
MSDYEEDYVVLLVEGTESTVDKTLEDVSSEDR